MGLRTEKLRQAAAEAERPCRGMTSDELDDLVSDQGKKVIWKTILIIGVLAFLGLLGLMVWSARKDNDQLEKIQSNTDQIYRDLRRIEQGGR